LAIAELKTLLRINTKDIEARSMMMELEGNDKKSQNGKHKDRK